MLGSGTLARGQEASNGSPGHDKDTVGAGTNLNLTALHQSEFWTTGFLLSGTADLQGGSADSPPEMGNL